MGDRANFGFKQADGNIVFLYGHWAGYQMMNTFAHALKRVMEAGRVGDESYATRIAISEIVGDSWKDDLGWGISVNYIGDNEHSVPVVDWATATVYLYDYDWKARLLTNEKFAMPLNIFVEKFAKDLTLV